MELTEFIPAAHSALGEARKGDRARLAEALGASRFVGVFGEAEVGKTSLLAHAFTDARVPPLRIDLQGAASSAHVSWLIARGLARQVLLPVQYSLLSGAPEIAPSDARAALIRLRDLIGSPLTDLAMADVPMLDIPLDEALGSLAAVADLGELSVWLDHVEVPGLTSRHPVDPGQLLWGLRAIAQTRAMQVAVSTQTAAVNEIAGPRAAFHQDGTWVEVQRPSVSSWVAVANALDLPVDGATVATMHDLLDGHPPSLLLALGEYAQRGRYEVPEVIVSRLASRDDGHAGSVMQHARSLHRLGGEVLSNVAAGQGPYASRGVSRPQDVNKALQRLQRAGLIYRPAKQSWRLTNPLLAIRLRGTLRQMAWSTAPDEWPSDPASASSSQRVGAGDA